MHKKDFQTWTNIKYKLQEKEQVPYFYERQIWFIYMGANLGYEQDGRGQMFLRPVMILKKFNQYLFWGIPLTSKSKKGKYYYEFSFLKNIKSNAVLSQLKLFDSKRLKHKKGIINKTDYQTIKKRLQNLIGC